MFKIGNFVSVFSNMTSDVPTMVAKIVGFDYDKEVVFVYDSDENTIEVPFVCVEAA